MKRRACVLTILFYIVFSASASAQQARLDSLLAANKNHPKEDSAKILLLIDIGKEYRKLKKTKERFVYIEAAIALGEKIKILKPLPALYNSCGLYYEGLTVFEKSIASYTRAIEISELFGDKKMAAEYILNFGTVYENLADYPRALALYQKSANYYIEINEPDELADCYINMGSLYNAFAMQTEKALEFLNKARILFEKANDGKGDPRGMAESYRSIAATYLQASDSSLLKLKIDPKEKFILAHDYYAKALTIAEKQKDSSLRAEVYEDAGNVNEQQMNYPSAITEYQNSLAIYTDLAHKKYVTQELLNLGRVYRKKNDLSSALPYLYTALDNAKQMKVSDMQSEAYFNLSGIQESLHHFDSAYFYYKQYIVMRDSVSNTEKQKEFTRKQLQFDFGIKEREYKMNQQLSGAKIAQQQQEIQLRNKQLELTNREKEIQKLNYLQKQSELEADRKLKTAQLKQQDLQRKLEAHISDQKINEQQTQISADRRLTMFLGAGLIVLAAAAFFVYRAQQKTTRLNKTVSAQKEELEEMGRVKDKIFSIVSHDMRAPVNNLIAFSSLLEDGHIEQEKLALYIDQIKGTLDHTSALMENLLNWAASQMQGFTPVMEEVNLFDVIHNVMKGIEQSLSKKKLSLENAVTKDLFVKGDKNMVELIIRNLLNNAVKFSKQGGRLEIFISDGSANKTLLAVRDSGVGISEAKVKLINASTVHSLETTVGTDKEKGTGLGLMLCKHFALLMNGNIFVESREGSGSMFTVSLPSA